MPMMRFTRPLINAGLKMVSLGKKIAIGLLIVIAITFEMNIDAT